MAVFRTGPGIDPAEVSALRGGRLDGYTNVYVQRFGDPRSPSGPGIDPQGPGTRTPGHPEQFSDRHKIQKRRIQIQKHPQTSSTSMFCLKDQLKGNCVAQGKCGCSKTDRPLLETNLQIGPRADSEDFAAALWRPRLSRSFSGSGYLKAVWPGFVGVHF